jgi:hypothetical protein
MMSDNNALAARLAVGVAVAVGAISTVVWPQAVAHHSFAMFDSEKCRVVQGTVRKVQWSYPHAWLWLSVPDAERKQQLFGFEGGAPLELTRSQGWTKGTVKAGDKITVAYNPLRNTGNGGAFIVVTLADGKQLIRQGTRNACDGMPPLPR